jgi:hypothetical protein
MLILYVELKKETHKIEHEEGATPWHYPPTMAIGAIVMQDSITFEKTTVIV